MREKRYHSSPLLQLTSLPNRLPTIVYFHQPLQLRPDLLHQEQVPTLQMLKSTTGALFASETRPFVVWAVRGISTAVFAGKRDTRGLMPDMKNDDTER